MEFETIDTARGEMPEEYRSYFQGTARVQRFTSPFGDRPAVSAVHFDAGARTRPHIHRSGQVLHTPPAAGSSPTARAGRLSFPAT